MYDQQLKDFNQYLSNIDLYAEGEQILNGKH